MPPRLGGDSIAEEPPGPAGAPFHSPATLAHTKETKETENLVLHLLSLCSLCSICCLGVELPWLNSSGGPLPPSVKGGEPLMNANQRESEKPPWQVDAQAFISVHWC
jgi:hypothetical protein